MTTSGVPPAGPPAEPAAQLVQQLRQRGETLATAESLTGGLVGTLLTAVPGASAVYRGGVITYATELKAVLAGVDAATLAADGPVAATTAQQMARGAALRCRARWGLSTTGVAGPDAQDGHPVGEVYIGLADTTTGWWFAARQQLSGSRADIRHQTARRALELLLRQLAATPPGDA